MNTHPPQVTPIFTRVIQDLSMPSGLLCSYIRLFAAAWRHAYQHTETLDFDAELAPLLGLRASQARQHLRSLRFAHLIDWRSDGNNHYMIYLTGPPVPPGEQAAAQASPQSAVVEPGTSGNSSPVDVVVEESNLNFKENIHQQQTYSALLENWKPGVPSDVESPLPPQVAAARQWLKQAGVWPDVAGRIAVKIAENLQRGHPYLPGPADVLGWIAYCFGDQQKNKITQPSAVLAANLNANRCCPDEYRPPAICSACGCAEDWCDCDPKVPLGYPDEYLEAALHHTHSRYDYTHNRWGICLNCGALSCRCGD